MAEVQPESDIPLFLPPENEDEFLAEAYNRKSSPVSSGCLSQTERAKIRCPKVSDVTMNDVLGDANGRQSSPPSSSLTRESSCNDKPPKAGPSTSSHPTTSQDSQRKKRKVNHTSQPILPRRSEYYLGSILVGNAWSTARGAGYIKSGDPIFVERDTLQEDMGNGKDQKKKTKGKQVTLNSMFKPQTKSDLAKKPKPNTVVRLTNARGFGKL